MTATPEKFHARPPGGRAFPRTAELSALVAGLPPPLVLFNKSHSGSRLLTAMLEAGGVFMGAHLNESRDSWDLVPVVRYLVTRHYPDYGPALAGADPLIEPMLAAALRRHLEGYDPAGGRPWGWKLCETSYILPVVAALFPQGRFVHLLRDGRDVAFSDHVGPTDAFWRKIYFGTAAIERWRGLALDGATYRRHAHLFNAQHWLASVRAGREAGRPLGERYREIRYETLCEDLAATTARLFDFLGLGTAGAAIAAVEGGISRASIGKFRSEPLRKRRAVLALIRPLQAELGYPVSET